MILADYTVEQLSRVLTASKWLLGIFAVLTASAGIFNQWLSDRIATLQQDDKTKAQQRLEASEAELRDTQGKVQLLESAAAPGVLNQTSTASLSQLFASASKLRE